MRGGGEDLAKNAEFIREVGVVVVGGEDGGAAGGMVGRWGARRRPAAVTGVGAGTGTGAGALRGRIRRGTGTAALRRRIRRGTAPSAGRRHG